jgi:hypothetical protein
VKPKLRWHRTNKVQHYEELTTLFTVSSATGAFSRSSNPTSEPSTPSAQGNTSIPISQRVRTRGVPLQSDSEPPHSSQLEAMFRESIRFIVAMFLGMSTTRWNFGAPSQIASTRRRSTVSSMALIIIGRIITRNIQVFQPPNQMQLESSRHKLPQPLIPRNQHQSLNDYMLSKTWDFPIISQRARDYHAIPATSAPSERVFSMAGNLISKKRTRISSENVRYVLCLRSWGVLKADDDEEEIIISEDSGKIVQV